MSAAGQGVVAGQAAVGAVVKRERVQRYRFICADVAVGNAACADKRQRFAAHAADAACVAKDVGVDHIGAVVGAGAAQVDGTHAEAGRGDGQVAASNVIALLGGVIAVVKAGVGAAGCCTQHVCGEVETAAGLCGAVVSDGGIRRASQGQWGQKAAQQGGCAPLINPPDGAAATSIGYAPPAVRGELLHLGGSLAGTKRQTEGATDIRICRSRNA